MSACFCLHAALYCKKKLPVIILRVMAVHEVFEE